MTDVEFITQATSLLARCSVEQRGKLAEMAQSYAEPGEAGAVDRKVAQDARRRPSLHERFPDLNRLKA